MAYDVKTPMLLEAAQAARDAINGIRNGSMERGDAMVLCGAAGRLIGVVSADIRARLAEPRIRAYEAQLIERRAEHRALASS